MGIVWVACRAGSTSVEDGAKITLTFLRTSSAASGRQLIDRFRPHRLHDDVFAVDIAKVAQSGAKHLDAAGGSGSGPKHQAPDSRNCG